MGGIFSCGKRVTPATVPLATVPLATVPPAPKKVEVQQPPVHIPPWYVVYYHTQPDNQRGFSVLWSDLTTMFFPVHGVVLNFKLFATHPLIIYRANANIWVQAVEHDALPYAVAPGPTDILDFAIVNDEYLFVLCRSSLSVYTLSVDAGRVSVQLVCTETSFGSFSYDKIAVDITNPSVFYVHGGDSQFAMACTFNDNEIDGRLLDFNSRLMVIIPGTGDFVHLARDRQQLAVSTMRNGVAVRVFDTLESLDGHYAHIQCVDTPTDVIVVGLAPARARRVITMTYLARSNLGGQWRKMGMGAPDPKFCALVPGPAAILNGVLVGYNREDRGDVQTPMRIAQYDIVTQTLLTDPRKLFVDEPYADNVENLEAVMQFHALYN